mmetsp:Transcript_21120/g.29193  ORF Transcript_21120/g.29193 Transcript_21120/m.29193 type:complete len:114 (+) Transcript_21120:2426-2767(+)
MSEVLPENEDIKFVTTYENGMTTYIFSQKTLPAYLQLNLLSFYISIVYVVATVFRAIFVPRTPDIYIVDATLTDDLLMVCSCIYIYRVHKQLIKEEELYFILIDIMRSPEMIK